MIIQDPAPTLDRPYVSFTYGPAGNAYIYTVAGQPFLPRSGSSTSIAGQQSGSATTLTVQSTTLFPTSGTLTVRNANDNVLTITYTGKTATTFTGCIGGYGLLLDQEAVFAAGIFTVSFKDPITFTGAVRIATPSTLWVVRHEWDFGDGQTGLGSTITHAFKAITPGHRVTYSVTDNHGRTFRCAAQLPFDPNGVGATRAVAQSSKTAATLA